MKGAALRRRSLFVCLVVAIGLLTTLCPPHLLAEQGEAGTDPGEQEANGESQGDQAENEIATKKTGGNPDGEEGDGTSDERPSRSGWSAAPIVSYAPETHFGLGAFGVHFFRLGDAPVESRTSSMAVVALYTTRHQFIGELIPEFYWNDERWHLWSKFEYRHYPNALWGVGNDLPESNEEWYLESGPRWRTWIRSMLVYSLYLQLRIDAQYMKISRIEEGGLLASGAVPGYGGGNTTGIGLTLGWDSRDHPQLPRRGGFHEISMMGWSRALGSRYAFSRFELNLRQFIPLFDTHALALQLYGEFLLGEPPFYRMALLGGQYMLRGYFEGRYRDNDLIAAQAEYRLPLFWRISAVLFAAAGDVSDRLGNFGLDDIKWAAGGGLRLMLSRDEKLNLRVDAAAGVDTWGIYATAKEAF